MDNAFKVPIIAYMLTQYPYQEYQKGLARRMGLNWRLWMHLALLQAKKDRRKACQSVPTTWARYEIEKESI